MPMQVKTSHSFQKHWSAHALILLEVFPHYAHFLVVKIALYNLVKAIQTFSRRLLLFFEKLLFFLQKLYFE